MARRLADPSGSAAPLLKRLRDADRRRPPSGADLVVAGMGGHVDQDGVRPVPDRLDRTAASSTAVAINGSAAIHDLELAISGRTSEDVGASPPGRHVRLRPRDVRAVRRRPAGMASAERGIGLGAALARGGLGTTAGPGLDSSLLVAARRRGHPPDGPRRDRHGHRPHDSPRSTAAALGKASLDDFRILCGTVVARWLNGGCLPESGQRRRSCRRSSSRPSPSPGTWATAARRPDHRQPRLPAALPRPVQRPATPRGRRDRADRSSRD